MEQRADCEVCKKLIREKNKHLIWWKLLCVCFAITTVIFGVLYFGSGSITTKTEIEIRNTKVINEGDSGTIIIGGEQVTDCYKGNIEKTDYTPIICLTIFGSVMALIIGGGIIANHIKERD